MGNNSAGDCFATMVVILYDEGVLTKTLLKKVATPFTEQDTDFGDAVDVAGLSKDALDYEQVVAKVCGKKVWKKPDLPDGDWTPAEDAANEAYQEGKAEQFTKALASIGIEFS